jgi:hypothetical protein
VQARAAALERMYQGRNSRLDDYERMYRLQSWKDTLRPNEIRVSLPDAHNTIEKYRALLMTRPPTITVPTTSNNPDDQGRAQKIERYLYGVSARTKMSKVLSWAEWYAVTFGAGFVKCVYDSNHADDEFPLIITSPDTRTLYWQCDGRDRIIELVQKWPRSRREIEAEWGCTLPRPSESWELESEAAWLDYKVDYIEYWTETTVWEKKEKGKPEPKLLTDLIGEAMQGVMAGQAGVDVEATLAGVEGEPAEEEEEEETRIRVRRVIHTVIVEDGAGTGGPAFVVKRAVAMPGYSRIPFVKFSGISTPLAGAGSDLSVLYPLAGGDGTDKAMGVLAAMNLLASIDLDSAIKAPNAPIISDDDAAELDMQPGAKNYVKPGSKVWRLTPDASNPAVQRSAELFTGRASQSGIPEIWSGEFHSLSGQALSGLATVFQMAIGFKQNDRQEALQDLFGLVLALTAKYSARDGGWRTYGTNATGQFVETLVKPADIGTNFRVTVKLSASMPKDTVGIASLLSMLESKGQLSLETMLDHLQKLPEFGLAAESPEDEIVRIYRNQLLKDEQFKGFITKALGSDVVQMMRNAGVVSPEAEQEAQQLLFPPPPMPMPAQGGPQQGMPPEMMAAMQAGQMPAGPMPAGMAGMQMGASPIPPMPGAGGPAMPMPAGMPPGMMEGG